MFKLPVIKPMTKRKLQKQMFKREQNQTHTNFLTLVQSALTDKNEKNENATNLEKAAEVERKLLHKKI